MTTWPVPADEAERLVQLPEYRLLGSDPEPIFDAVAEAAARAYGVPIALISLVGEKDQWLKARWGLDVPSTPRAQSFCTHTIAARSAVVWRRASPGLDAFAVAASDRRDPMLRAV